MPKIESLGGSMFKTARVLLYFLLAAFFIRLGWLNEDVNYEPPPLTLIEFSLWSLVWVLLAQLGLTQASQKTQEILGALSWALTIMVSGLWLNELEMHTLLKWCLFAGFWTCMIIVRVRHHEEHDCDSHTDFAPKPRH